MKIRMRKKFTDRGMVVVRLRCVALLWMHVSSLEFGGFVRAVDGGVVDGKMMVS